MATLRLLAVSALAQCAMSSAPVGERGSAAPTLAVTTAADGSYSVAVDGQTWYQSTTTPYVCIAGDKNVPLTLQSSTSANGSDKFGAWTGVQLDWLSAGSTQTPVQFTLKSYASNPSLAVLTATFPNGMDTSNCGSNQMISVTFPAFQTQAGAGLASSLGALSWDTNALQKTKAVKGLAALGNTQIDSGPVISYDQSPQSRALVWSTLDSHKIVIQNTNTSGNWYGMGVTSAIPSIPAGWNYSVMLSASYGGPTAATYAWGSLIRSYYNTYRSSSVTLDKIGYYTDDGAYYYVWEAFNIPARPFTAEDGLVQVKEALYAMGVPVAYMQLDDWWYQGPFYFGNVKAILNWTTTPTATRLFPSGLPSFSDRLGLDLQLYTPFWDQNFQTPYNMTPSTQFPRTKLVTPDDSYAFFCDLFDLGSLQTNGRFSTFEIDFLDANFAGSASMFETVHSADDWYAGMANAALERGVTIQYCLPSATDMLQSLSYPSVVQARASEDYVQNVGNAFELGGSSLLMGAVSIAPSKDTLWTASPQSPPTWSDTMQGGGYTTQPHVQLDAILATLSLGPVGISDGLNQTDPNLISQSFMSPTDGTLLRPSRPLSWVDSVFYNRSFVNPNTVLDIRSTHALVPAARGNDPTGPFATSHYVVAWRTTAAAQLQATDLYPAPSTDLALAVRAHVVTPAGAAQYAGCTDGQPASPSCVTILPAGVQPSIPATGGNPDDQSLTVVYEPLSNGAWFLGELSKFVHVSPQRFEYILAGSTAEQYAAEAGVGVQPGPAGLIVGVKGTAGQSVTLVAIDATQTTRVVTVVIPESGFLDVGM